jgi:hypothetical protein
MLNSCWAYSSALKVEATCSSETPVDFQRTTRRHLAEDTTLHNHRCDNLRSCIIFSKFSGEVCYNRSSVYVVDNYFFYWN